MRRKLAILVVVAVLYPTAIYAQTAAYNQFCQQGGKFVSTSGLNSTTKVQASFPKCTVTVYLTGTLTIATIFSNSTSSPLANPFQANTDGSFLFYAATTACYDVVTSVSTSGGTPPMPNPFTYTDICLGSGGGGGGGSGVNPGTPFEVTRYDVTGTNIQDSRGSDNPANGPTRWPSGLNVIGDAGYLQDTVGTAGVVANELVEFDSNANIVVASASSTKPKGIAHVDGAAGASIPRAVWGRHPCIFDGLTVANDFVAPSTVGGQCADVGATKPTNVVIIGTVVNVNTGAGTLANVDMLPWDTIAPGASGGSGTVGPCSGSNCDAYYPAPGTLVLGDTLATDDGIGHKTAKSVGLTDATFAGFAYWLQGADPGLPPTGGAQIAAPVSVTTPYEMLLPATPATGCLQGVNAAGVVTLSFSACPGSTVIRGISFTIGDPGGSVIPVASTTTDYVTVPFGCTISAYNLAIDAGTITVKFWKIATGTAIPTSANSINTSGVSISSGTAIHSATLTDFTTTTVTANDIMAMNVTAASGSHYINGVLACQ